uniref:Uncharacterized protein n=1 Tax=Rhizophora mucronata TaxID=61149 RepID=A0A2P2Q5R0_RHIMU
MAVCSQGNPLFLCFFLFFFSLIEFRFWVHGGFQIFVLLGSNFKLLFSETLVMQILIFSCPLVGLCLKQFKINICSMRVLLVKA